MYGIPYMWNLKGNDTNELIYRNKLRKEVMVAGRKDVRKG